jgi:myosin V
MDSRLVYIPDKEEVWLPRTLLSQEGTSVTVTTLNKDEPSTTIDLTPYEKLMKRVNRKTESGNGEEKVDIWTLPMVNEGKVGLVGDMTLLGFLGEPQILYNLRKRFESQIPYTATGDVIVAVNPYFRIANLYGKDLGATYLNQAFILAKGGQVETKLPPHVYTTSARAFADLISKHNNQSVLVSGESGAGKTETTKIMINFLVGSSPQIGSSNQATKILGANPLLESFGNAKTVRNDNSSRFGKCKFYLKKYDIL